MKDGGRPDLDSDIKAATYLWVRIWFPRERHDEVKDWAWEHGFYVVDGGELINGEDYLDVRSQAYLSHHASLEALKNLHEMLRAAAQGESL